MCLSPNYESGNNYHNSFYYEKSLRQISPKTSNNELVKKSANIIHLNRNNDQLIPNSNTSNIFKKIIPNSPSHFANNTKNHLSPRYTNSTRNNQDLIIMQRSSNVLKINNPNSKLSKNFTSSKKIIKNVGTNNNLNNTENIRYINLNSNLNINKLKENNQKYNLYEPVNNIYNVRTTTRYNINDKMSNFQKSLNYINKTKLIGNHFYKNNSNNNIFYNKKTNPNPKRITKTDIQQDISSRCDDTKLSNHNLLEKSDKTNNKINFILNLKKLNESKSTKDFFYLKSLKNNKKLSHNQILTSGNTPRNYSIYQQQSFKNNSYLISNSTMLNENSVENIETHISKKQSTGDIGINNNIIEHIQINLFNNDNNKNNINNGHIKYSSDRFSVGRKVNSIYMKIDNKKEKYKRKTVKKTSSMDKEKNISIINGKIHHSSTCINNKVHETEFYDAKKEKETELKTFEESHFYAVYHIQKVKNQKFE